MAQPASPSDTQRRHRSYAVTGMLNHEAPNNVPKQQPIYPILKGLKAEANKVDPDEKPEINSVSDIDNMTPSPSPQPHSRSPVINLTMQAISAFKCLLNGDALLDSIPLSKLEAAAPIFEALVAGNYQSAISKNFQADDVFQRVRTSLKLDEVCLDFDLLDGDYAAIKSTFVDGDANNRSSVRIDRLMPLLIGAEVSSVKLRNVTISATTMECIFRYIAVEDHYGEQGLKANVNDFVVHRRDGLEWDEIQAEFEQQFLEHGWVLTIDRKRDVMLISIDWEYYDYDYNEEPENEDEPEDDDDAQPPPPPPPRPLESGNDAEIEHREAASAEIKHGAAKVEHEDAEIKHKAIEIGRGRNDDDGHKDAEIQRLKQELAEKDQALSKEKRDRAQSRENARWRARRARKESHARHEQEMQAMEKEAFVFVWEYKRQGRWTPFHDDVQATLDAIPCDAYLESSFKEFKLKGSSLRHRVTRLTRDGGLYIARDGRIETIYNVRRRRERRQTAIKFPKWWTISRENAYDKLKLKEMNLKDDENALLQRARAQFRNAMPPRWRILKIKSVENRMLYDQHVGAEQLLMKSGQKPNVQYLWHGSSPRAIRAISKQGFRKECGPRARWGQGSYFSTDASTGAFSTDAYQSAKGYRVRGDKDVFQMLYCRVICGQSVLGHKAYTLKNWPHKENGAVCDSLVDDTGSIYVIHDDARAYPLFVVYFFSRT